MYFVRLILVLTLTIINVVSMGNEALAASTQSKVFNPNATSKSMSVSGDPKTRIKDIVSFEGVRPNQLVGYGLVIGLNGTGDSLRKAIFTKESLVSMLDRMGINVREAGDIDTKNVAAVIVTATLPPFARQGSSIDVVVSAMGDAKNLLGGTLLVTPLVGADGEVYAVAQGPVATSGFTVQGKASSVTKGVPTSGRIANGAIVEREVNFSIASMETISLSLRNPDFTTARRIEQAVNGDLGEKCAQALDSATVQLKIPGRFEGDRVAFLTQIEQLQIIPDQSAKVIVDDHDGVIVMGDKTKISRVAVSHGSITVSVTEEDQISQPNSFTGGTGPVIEGTSMTLAQTGAEIHRDGSISINPPAQTVGAGTPPAPPGAAPIAPTGKANPDQPVQIAQNTNTGGQNQNQTIDQLRLQGAGGASTQRVNRTKIGVDEGDNSKMAVVQSGANLQDLVNSLNALGASPRDMITILQSIKAAGALQASIEVI